MFRKLIGCFCAVLFVASVSWAAADPFLGTWTAEIAKTRQATPGIPPNWQSGTMKVEAFANGYKVTSTFTFGGNTLVQVGITDLKEGVSTARDEKGNEIEKFKALRKSPMEIETTSLKSGMVTNYKILPSGEAQITISDPKGKMPTQTYYYKRAS